MVVERTTIRKMYCTENHRFVFNRRTLLCGNNPAKPPIFCCSSVQKSTSVLSLLLVRGSNSYSTQTNKLSTSVTTTKVWHWVGRLKLVLHNFHKSMSDSEKLVQLPLFFREPHDFSAPKKRYYSGLPVRKYLHSQNTCCPLINSCSSRCTAKHWVVRTYSACYTTVLRVQVVLWLLAS